MRIIWRVIFDFFILAWRLINFIRNLIANIFFIFLIIIFMYYWIYISNVIQTKHSDKVALLLNINGTIVDKPSSTNSRLGIISRQLLSTSSNQLQENSLFDIVDTIRKAKDDHNISGIILDLKNFLGTDQPSMKYIGKVLREFRNSGKPIVAIGSNYSQEQYYLASFANKIWLSPQGEVDLRGLVSNNLYYKSLLDKLKITTHLFRVGTYKSAVEPFIRNNMSPAVRKINNDWINELWESYLSTISINRCISVQQAFPGAKEIVKKIHKMNGDTAQYALSIKLVDKLGSSIEIEKALSDQFGWSEKNKNYRAISIYDYMSSGLPKEGDAIAVIFVNGIIIDGNEIPGSVNGDTIAKQIRNARLDSKVKAIVLRINSPGGSVKASEIICEELTEIRSAGKPIVVSMGGMAASGGYWISTPANYIIADQSTITGSIGVFGIINTIENSLEYLGIHTDGVNTSPLADVTLTKTLPLEVSQMMQIRIENGYKRFIKLVAKSRKKTPEQIDIIAQGHVWTGKNAKNNGLIDSLGDFDDSVIKAAELAKLKQWHLYYYKDSPDFLNMIVHKISESILTKLLYIIQIYSPISGTTTTIEKAILAEKNKSIIFNDLWHNCVLCLAYVKNY